MKISFLLQNVFTSTFFWKRPSNYTRNLNVYDFNISNNITLLQNYDLPINYNTIQKCMLMSYYAYKQDTWSNWEKIMYNLTDDVSVGPNDIKAFLFSDKDKLHNIIAIKGTTLFDIFNSTVAHDKLNDNLFFSCCFYKQSTLFKDYCIKENNTQTDKYECKKSCYLNILNMDNYITMLPIIIDNISKIIDFKTSNVYFTGHSLGGFLAVYLGLKYNKQVITFDSPGEKHFLDLLNINYDKRDTSVYHFGHTADSIMNGECGNLCKLVGYNIETKCKIGNSCIYDSKKKLDISNSILTHKLDYIIKYILPEWKNDFPLCYYNSNLSCKENCNKWLFK